MKLLFVADGRSPIALNWIRYFTGAGHEVHLASLYRCNPMLDLASLTLLPSLLQRFTPEESEQRPVEGKSGSGRLQRLLPVSVRTALRQWLMPVSVRPAVNQLSFLLGQLKPDLVHAMRIPYEGIVTALADPEAPVVTSVWGNDFTLHAKANPWLARYTRLSVRRTTALHSDCQRDQRLARLWGFSASKPSVVLPGGGGIQPEIFYPAETKPGKEERPDQLKVINPRGMRAYMRNDAFFRSIPLVGERIPQARFVCPGMAGDPQAERWVADLGIQDRVELLPAQTRQQMAALFRGSAISVSPSTHDGTPNTLLEAMACGCFPVLGDLESTREWITPGVNGYLVDPGDHQALAEAIVAALQNPHLRAHARQINRELIAVRADYHQLMPQAEAFYRALENT